MVFHILNIDSLARSNNLNFVWGNNNRIDMRTKIVCLCIISVVFIMCQRAKR